MINIKAPSDRYKRRSEEARSRPDYWVARLAYRFAGQITRVIAERGLSRADLARRVGVKPSYVTKVLKGDGNYTIKTMVKIAHALGYRADVILRPENEPFEFEPVGWEWVCRSDYGGLSAISAKALEHYVPTEARSEFTLFHYEWESISAANVLATSDEDTKYEKPVAA